MTIECYRNNMLQKAFMAGGEGGWGGGGAITKTRHRQVQPAEKLQCTRVLIQTNLVPRAFPLKNFLREKPWGRGCIQTITDNS